MTTGEGDGPIVAVGTSESVLAGLVEEITRRVQRGEPVTDTFAHLEAAHRDEIRRLILALGGLADLRNVGVREVELPSATRDEQGRPTLGDFRVIREIGRGGSGVVYEAEQVPLGRSVALKVLTAAAELDRRAARRFELEAQVAGLLDHPRIVPVYAVGASGPTPYIAMRMIDGCSLAALVDDLRGESGPSSLAESDTSGTTPPPRSPRSGAFAREVARIGAQAAEALGYAHERGVTHRDIKPANLLLDGDGQLWVADFGMAAVRGDAGLTATGDLLGTVRYMSPEQATGRRAEVDHRTDIYSLGVTLYELLAVRPAVGGSDRQEILRRVVEEEPTPLRRLNPTVPVDLATVIAKAMAKSPAGRYATAQDLAEDLGRFLTGRPVAARPVGPTTRAWRWCRRNRPQAALVASLLAGLVGVAWGWAEAERRGRLLKIAAAEARKEAARFAAIDRLVVARARGEPATVPVADPEAEVTALLAIGKLYDGIGEYAKAEAHLRSALAILDRRADAPTPERLRVEARLGLTLGHLGRLDEAEPLLRGAYERARARPTTDPQGSLLATAAYAEYQTRREQFGEAERLIRICCDESRAAQPPDVVATLTFESRLADVLGKQKRYPEAAATYRHILGEAGRASIPDDQILLVTMVNLAQVEAELGEVEAAEGHFREAIGRSLRSFGPNHDLTLMARYNLAEVLQKTGRHGEAEPAFMDALAAFRARHGPEHPLTLNLEKEVAAYVFNRGRTDEAEALLRSCLANQRRILGADHADTRGTIDLLDQMIKLRRASVDRLTDHP